MAEFMTPDDRLDLGTSQEKWWLEYDPPKANYISGQGRGPFGGNSIVKQNWPRQMIPIDYKKKWERREKLGTAYHGAIMRHFQPGHLFSKPTIVGLETSNSAKSNSSYRGLLYVTHFSDPLPASDTMVAAVVLPGSIAMPSESMAMSWTCPSSEAEGLAVSPKHHGILRRKTVVRRRIQDETRSLGMDERPLPLKCQSCSKYRP